MRSLLDTIQEHLGVDRPVSVLIVIAGLFIVAWLISRMAAELARGFVTRSERRRTRDGVVSDTGVITGIRQRETAISLVQTSIRYVVFALALVLSLATIAGAQRVQTVIGASFVALIIAFAAQRFLMDVIAGLLMFFEGWFRIGDTVAIDALKVEGVVEGVSLRSMSIRSITGESIHVPNSQVIALRVMPRGYREVEFEFFTRELEAGRELVDKLAEIVPVGTTRFVRRPELVESERLDDNLFRITGHCAVAVGREWLADDLLPTLLRERAGEGLLVHGPIVTFIDEQASRSFARAIVARNRAPSSDRAGYP